MKLGFVSDIHEDELRLKKAIGILKSRKCNKLICLGDLVGYSVPFFSFLKSRKASAVIEMVKKDFDIVVSGNHDLFVAEKIPRYKAGFKYPANWYKLDYFKRQKLSGDKIFLYESNELPSLLTKRQADYLGGLPEYVVKKFGNTKILFSHYAYPDLSGGHNSTVNNETQLNKHIKFMQKLGCQLSFSGHEHREGARIISPNGVFDYGFGSIKIEPDVHTWVTGPCVAKGTFANGVMIFDTDTYELEIIPLKSKILKNL